MGFKDWVSIFIMLVPAFMFAFIKDYTAMGIFAGISFATILIINLKVKSIAFDLYLYIKLKSVIIFKY